MTAEPTVDQSTVAPAELRPPARRRRWPAWVLPVVGAAWLVFVALQLSLAPVWPLWTLADLVPPLLFLVVPVLVLLLAVPWPVARIRMPVWARIGVIAVEVAALALGVGRSGVNWPASPKTMSATTKGPAC